jgi:flagellar hook-associated protein 2
MAGVTFSGFNGFDFGSIIDAIMQYESQPLTALQTQQQSVKDKDAALVQLNSFISSLQTSASSLTNASTFSNVASTSSDPTIATTTAGSGALAGRYDVSIAFLAKGQVTTSTNGYGALDDVVADSGSLSFTIDGTTTTAIDITQATTLAELKDAINNQGSGVVASIVNTGSSYKLVVSSRATGATNGFTINSALANGGGAVVGFAAGQSPTAGNVQDARDSQFSVNGLPITSSSNDITDAIPGMTLKLITAGNVVVDVNPDYGAVKDSLKSVVTQYNKLKEFFARQSGNDPLTGKRAPLGGDSIMRQALNDLRSVVLGANSNGGRYQYLAEIGVELTANGELKLDETKFNAAINGYPSDVEKLFQGTTGSGIFDEMKTRLDALDGTAGLIKTTRTSIDNTLKSYRSRIESQQLRLDIRRQELTRMYAAADEAMSKLSAMSSQIAGLGRQ